MKHILKLICVLCSVFSAFSFSISRSYSNGISLPRWRIFATADSSSQVEVTTKALEALSSVIDPDSGNDIVETGVVAAVRSIDNIMEVDLVITKSNVAIADELKKLCILNLSMLDEVSDVTVNFVTEKASETQEESIIGASGLEKVKNIIAVSSCKGGVGKSTVSVNLAYTLREKGAKVGILDADIYGPSLPTMTSPTIPSKLYDNNRLMPLEYEGVKLMSLGFITKGAAIMRGPMVNQVLNQFVSLADWGDLDYLIIDMPPGTGDIQLTLAQTMNITAAVIVTTPQKLSFVDVVKGIDMFDTVNVPSIAVVENMAEFSTYNFDNDFYESIGNNVVAAVMSSVDKEGKPMNGRTFSDIVADAAEITRKAVEKQRKSLRLFGSGHLQRLKDMWGIGNLVSLPLLTDISVSGDSGRPYVLSHKGSSISQAFNDLADGIMKEIEQINSQVQNTDALYFNEDENKMEYGDEKLSPFELRCDCRCAVCVEELTGEKLLNTASIPRDIRPLGMAPIGKYAISVDWSDGHKSLYPYKQIASLASKHID